MSVSAKIIASSINAFTGRRIDTFQLRYWRAIHGEVMTHRKFSRNASSSRAIPYSALTVRDADIFIPKFRVNQPGMQPGEYLSPEQQEAAAAIWSQMAAFVLEKTKLMAAKDGLNIHKQYVNRPLEWFGYIDVVLTSTDWSNFDGLRIHGDAQEEIRDLAVAMKEARDAATPTTLEAGQWHLPYVTEQDRLDVAQIVASRALAEESESLIRYLASLPGLGGEITISLTDALLLAISTARCCRVSYSKHDGTTSDIDTDVKLFLRLAGSVPMHASPLEHQARPLEETDEVWHRGNFDDFAQFRKFIPNECL